MTGERALDSYLAEHPGAYAHIGEHADYNDEVLNDLYNYLRHLHARGVPIRITGDDGTDYWLSPCPPPDQPVELDHDHTRMDSSYWTPPAGGAT